MSKRDFAILPVAKRTLLGSVVATCGLMIGLSGFMLTAAVQNHLLLTGGLAAGAIVCGIAAMVWTVVKNVYADDETKPKLLPVAIILIALHLGLAVAAGILLLIWFYNMPKP